MFAVHLASTKTHTLETLLENSAIKAIKFLFVIVTNKMDLVTNIMISHGENGQYRVRSLVSHFHPGLISALMDASTLHGRTCNPIQERSQHSYSLSFGDWSQVPVERL